MEMDDEFLEVNDLDWFASCQDGFLAHFTTGGRGLVPFAVRKSISKNEAIYNYFISVDDSADFDVIEENLPTFSGDAQRERYLLSFVDMARRGLLSYDVSNDGGYKLIARPKKNREFSSLPQDVKDIIHMLPLSFSVRIDKSGFI
ncbi:hypothetical protein [Pseudomonas syringae group sp. J248-6]|uniref:hypothetical protein n=1 Tax=Pseudomonas syringae group sp. J248-6 TaxID=3079590 RepID=UPI00290C49F6|nr:hypothetical protein [Pseudomonas syringae group sp. J248-6]MDU8541291.1 hypothetical protein [Pseudomonas syringae group sp. J248-6]